MKLQDAEKLWLDQTEEEEVRFALFAEPKLLRRPRTGMKALAALHFGGYQDMSGTWITDDRVIWLQMIMSEQPGEGARLLGQICRLASGHGLAICGEPVSLKPASWDETRHWSGRVDDLIIWYLRHDFRVVQSKWRTRVWHVPPGLDLVVGIELIDKARVPAKTDHPVVEEKHS